jgi:predicted nucleic acid-binding protein
VTHVYWDTNMFIYLWENNATLGPATQQLWKQMLAAKVGLVTSTMTLGEIRVGPLRKGQEDVAAQYRAAIKAAATVVPFDEKAADRFATIRAETPVKQPDGIHLASAAVHGVELFITNDEKLCKLRIPGIHFIVSIDTALRLLA